MDRKHAFLTWSEGITDANPPSPPQSQGPDVGASIPGPDETREQTGCGLGPDRVPKRRVARVRTRARHFRRSQPCSAVEPPGHETSDETAETFTERNERCPCRRAIGTAHRRDSTTVGLSRPRGSRRGTRFPGGGGCGRWGGTQRGRDPERIVSWTRAETPERQRLRRAERGLEVGRKRGQNETRNECPESEREHPRNGNPERAL